MKIRISRLGLVLAIVLAAPWAARAQSGGDWKARVEADWLKQEDRRRMSPMVGQATAKEDALGAVDGVKDGQWGFHTGDDDQPWWQVDLGDAGPLGRVVVYNRCDGGCAARNVGLRLLTSTDGKEWTERFRHSGAPFGGVPDGKPLVVTLDSLRARFVRLQYPGHGYLHLDEVEVYAPGDDKTDLALWKPADQSSVSQWSVRHAPPDRAAALAFPVGQVVERGLKLAADLARRGIDTRACRQSLAEVAAEAVKLPETGADEARRELYLKARWLIRDLAFRNPLLDFDRIVFVKRAPTLYSHMSDQNYGWWSRPGGGLYVLEGYKEGEPRLKCLTEGWPEGNFNSPDLSYDGTRMLFAYCRYHPESAGNPNKLDKATVPEDVFYHVYELGLDGSGLRQLTHGKYDDFDPRYLPSGEIVFLSTRRGQSVRCTSATAAATLTATLPDSYVRCGGDNARPVAVYTLHVMDADGQRVRPISAFENFEWTPSVAHDGRILYARWDYVDRSNMPYMKLWSTHPDGTQPEAVYGNFTPSLFSAFEPRAIPGSEKVVFTASAHHSVTAGSLVLLDPRKGFDGAEPITRLTPEVCFPEVEGWPASYYSSPYPLSETYYLTAWSDLKLAPQGQTNPVNAMGVYLFDAFGNLELLYRDPSITSMYPLPVKPRSRPPALPTGTREPEEAHLLLLNVYEGLPGVAPGTVKSLRVVGVPAKTQPQPNTPVLGMTGDDPGKFVLGTVPVEADGSAYLHVPAGLGVFFQALDRDGIAVQTMRTLTYAQAGETLSCVGCHEPRQSSPGNASPLALRRAPSKLAVGPEGSWPLRFDQLVQPVLDRRCGQCHRPDNADPAKSPFDLTAAHAWGNLVAYGQPSLRDHVLARYGGGRSLVGEGAAATNPVLKLLRAGHHDVRLDDDDSERLVTWMDTYGQVRGSFSDEQEQRLRDLRAEVAPLLEERGR